MQRRAFTLVEVLLAMAIFAFGGAALIALFLGNAGRAAQAGRETHMVDIASSLRGIIDSSLQLAPIIVSDDTGAEPRRLYPLAIPEHISLRKYDPANPSEQDTRQDGPRAWYFELPSKPAVGKDIDKEAGFTVLPREILDIKGNPLREAQGARVFYFRPTDMKRAEKQVGNQVDLDDRETYAFSFYIVRGVSRSDLPSPTGQGNRPLDGFYQAQLKIYRGFDETSVENVPIYDEAFAFAAPE